ncbi:glycerate kinase [Mumia sp. ZJ1417]|uniref:glycerate kinase family protein n=1 Tax=Mumia sp. ZJ1417 TaxID=2708082 RepID=UPI001420F0F1|nr:glycerate kinase [Mumia sp. ZJ1417]QMW67709.1 glycerate kinase [Mumia sp. ZJ1417]
MRVLVAPGAFAGALSASAAGEAIASGWSRTAPGDVLDIVPMSGAGRGFVDALHASVGGERTEVDVRGPLGGPVRGLMLLADDGRRTAFVESASACGPHVAVRRAPLEATSAGVGDLIAAALEAGAQRIVVGLGDSATTDGGAGMLSALGARADVPLAAGPGGLAGVSAVDLGPVRERIGPTELVVATDVGSPMLGLFGAVRSDGPGKGLDDAAVARVDTILDAFVVAVCGPGPAQRRVADAAGAGAAGGLGFALQVLGATSVPGVAAVADLVGLQAAARATDVVLTGVDAYDVTSREGTVVYGVAAVAGAALRPCVVLADRVEVGARERRAMGVEAAYATADLLGEQAGDDAGERLARLAERIARTWSQV